MSTSLFLMVQPENGTGVIRETCWVDPFPLNPGMSEVHSGVISFLQTVGVNPITDGGTCGDLIDQHYTPMEQANYLAELVFKATQNLNFKGAHSGDLGVRMCLVLLARAITLLTEADYDEDSGLLTRRWRVCLRWS